VTRYLHHAFFLGSPLAGHLVEGLSVDPAIKLIHVIVVNSFLKSGVLRLQPGEPRAEDAQVTRLLNKIAG